MKKPPADPLQEARDMIKREGDRLMADPKFQEERRLVRAKFTLLARLLHAKDEQLSEFDRHWVIDSGVSSLLVPGPMLDLKRAVQALKENPNDRTAYKAGLQAVRSAANIMRHWKKTHPSDA